MLVSRDLLVAIVAAIALHSAPMLFSPPTRSVPLEIVGRAKVLSWTISRVEVSTSNTASSAAESQSVHAEDIGVKPPSPSSPPSAGATQKVLSSTYTAGWDSSDFHEMDEIDTPAVPMVDWILPFKKGYLNEVSALIIRVWIRSDGDIAGAELLDIGESNLNSIQMQEIIDWLASTPMNPAMKNGEKVASKRTVEIAFEH